MPSLISRLRAERTRTRQHSAGRRQNELDASALAESPAIRKLLAAGLWAAGLASRQSVRGLPSDMDALWRMLGDGLMLAVGLGACYGALAVLRPRSQPGAKALVLALIMTAGTLAVSATMAALLPSRSLAWPLAASLQFLAPLALPSFIAVMLLDGATAVVTGAWVALCAAVTWGYDLDVFVLGLGTSAAAVYFGRDARRRGTLFEVGAMTGVTGVLLVVAGAAISGAEPETVAAQAGACMATGMLLAVLALVLLPLLEAALKFTSNITLLEFSDLSHPLLQRLALEAPGTYHHSLVVANLSQAAAATIGANALLARVCAYFHDVGKLTKPGYFSENIHGQNPHDELSPTMSALVILAHVKEGYSIGALHKLPRPIMDLICQHHGTQLVHYFYHKARRLAEPPDGHAEEPARPAIAEADFRYPGPKPASREAAIIAIADAVEAASRSMERITPKNAEALVDDIVEERLRDGQFDESALTLSELKEAKRAIVFTLANMFHGRTPYPRDESRGRQPPEPRTRQETDAGAAGRPPADAGAAG